MSNADGYKPGDLAIWDPPYAISTVWVKRDHVGAWRAADGSVMTYHADHPHLHHVLGPDERAVPKGGVWLDPEADAERLVAVMAAHRWTGLDDEAANDMRAVIRSLAAAQSEPPLEEPGHDALVLDMAAGEHFIWDDHSGAWVNQHGTGFDWAGLVQVRDDLKVFRPDAHDAGGPARDGQEDGS